MTGVATDLLTTIERTVEGLGYEFVDAGRLAGGLLRVTLDSAKGVGLSDCERVSRQLTHVLAVEGIDYQRLEVSSPGVDRPLRSARDFARFVGSEVQLQLYAALDSAQGRRRLQGRLCSIDGAPGAERIRIEMNEVERQADTPGGARGAKKPKKKSSGKVSTRPAVVVEVGLSDVEKAKLVPELNFRGVSKE